MRILKNYQSLIIDTLFYLENLEEEFIETIDPFFKIKIEKKIKSSNNLVSKKQSRNIDVSIPSQVEDKPKPSTPKVELIVSKKEEKIEPLLKELSPTALPLNKTDEIISSKAIKNDIENKKIKLDEKPNIIEDNFNDIKNIVSKISPNTKICDESLDDKVAKQRAQKYKLKNIAANLTILAYKENEMHYKFLEKISIALNNYFYPSKVISAYTIEKENNWDMFLSENEIFLIIASDYTIFELPYLRKHYKENPSSKEKFLKNIPLFLLPDISMYLKEPTLKISLFKTLKQTILNLKK
jgi:hypothetical protein